MSALSSVLSGEPAVNAGISSGVSNRYAIRSSADSTPPRLSSAASRASRQFFRSAATSSPSGLLVATRITSEDRSSAEKTYVYGNTSANERRMVLMFFDDIS